MNKEECVVFKGGKAPVIPTDVWIIENQNDELFRSNKTALIAPVSRLYPDNDGNIDYFILSPKKCYYSDDMRNHTCLYLNYFSKFYDVRWNPATNHFEQEYEYFSLLARIKFMIDYEPYTQDQFLFDIKRYILSPSIYAKVRNMVDDNYCVHLKYKNPKNPALEYSDEHGKIMMHMSILMNLCIPLLTHFAYKNKIDNIDDFLLITYDYIFTLYDVDIYNKLYETSTTNIKEKARNDEDLWGRQDIRGINITTHAQTALRNIIFNIIPKYNFNQSVVSLNFVSIKNTNKFTIDVEYEFNYISLSSSKRDEDSTSEFDKFESYLIKQSEGLYIQNTVNSDETMKLIDNLYGPFDQDEIDFYIHSLGDYDSTINPFQKILVFYVFFKYFGDPASIKAINRISYVKLLIAAKKVLLSNSMKMLPYIIGGKPEKIIMRKSMNKRDLTAMMNSPLYPLVLEKYNGNEKIMKELQDIAATIIVSDFSFIDYHNPDLHGERIEIIPGMITEEVLMFALLI